MEDSERTAMARMDENRSLYCPDTPVLIHLQGLQLQAFRRLSRRACASQLCLFSRWMPILTNDAEAGNRTEQGTVGSDQLPWQNGFLIFFV